MRRHELVKNSSVSYKGYEIVSRNGGEFYRVYKGMNEEGDFETVAEAKEWIDAKT